MVAGSVCVNEPFAATAHAPHAAAAVEGRATCALADFRSVGWDAQAPSSRMARPAAPATTYIAQYTRFAIPAKRHLLEDAVEVPRLRDAARVALCQHLRQEPESASGFPFADFLPRRRPAEQSH